MEKDTLYQLAMEMKQAYRVYAFYTFSEAIEFKDENYSRGLWKKFQAKKTKLVSYILTGEIL